SKRKRGSVQRTQRKRNRKPEVLARKTKRPRAQCSPGTPGSELPPRKSVVPSALITIMAVYSPRKNSANFIELYSVWKPPTSSDSHSAKSKGWRLVSAKIATTKRKKAKGCITQNHRWP